MIYIFKLFFPIWSLLVVKSYALAQLPPGTPITLPRLDQMIYDISTFLIRVSAVLAVIFIIWSGITYMYAGEDKTRVDNAKLRLRNGIMGSLIIFGVGVITGEFFCQGLWIPGVNMCL